MLGGQSKSRGKNERVVEDLPTAVEELNKEQQEAPVEEVVTDVEGFSGEPHDTSVMRDFEHHIALRVWNGEERPELKLSSHGRKMTKFGRPAPEIEGLMAASRRSPLIAWAFHNFEQLHVDDAVDMLVELLEMKIEACHWIVAARAYLLHLLGCILFANKSSTHVQVIFLDALRDLMQSGTYALDAAALVHMIYEHFLFVGSALAAKDYDERRLPACQWTSSKALSMSTYCRWMQFNDYIALVEQICVVPDQCSSDYMDWFYMILHSFMSSAQPGDSPRVPSVQQYDTFVQPDVHPQLVATTTPDEADVDVHHLRHLGHSEYLEKVIKFEIIEPKTDDEALKVLV
ncbi:hypothetical protein GmHk_08G023715 [Glycine max]|nr:hypothetical protein GmHk_08G023715 [Glycine max]